MHNPLFVHTSALTWICVPSPCRSRSHEQKKKYYDNISNVLLIQRKKKTKKEAAAANTKKKKEAKFAGHHQIPILFASTFIIVMIFISSSHHQSLKSQVLLQNKKKKTSKISYYRHNYQQTLVTPALLRPSAEVLPHLPVAARRITVRRGGAAACMRKTTCELCKGGTIWLTMHRPPRGGGRCKILGMLMNFPCGTFLWSRQKYWGW